ncbi:hypothetical protein GGI00_002455 [Coemansia sp. RSA 2681]|nr:hypothetical protein GGI00_002455 [Coemansia sp. RSA 2681]
MGPVHRLSDTLVLNIILFAANPHTTTLDEWKANLPYAAVCRQWRHQIIDMVYSSAILECHKTRTRWIKQLVTPGRKVPRYEWKSNMALIAATCNSRRTTELRIQLPYHERGILPIHNVLAALGLGSFFWPGIRTLHISKRTIAGCKDSHAAKRDSGYANRQAEIVSFFAKHVPLIGSLSLPTVSGNYGDLCSLYSKLVNHYARSLWHLSSPNSTVFSVSAFSSNLTDLSVRLSSSKPFWLPRLNIATIQHLQLTDVPHDFAWTRLIADGNDDDYYEFTRLVSLHIEFSESCQLFSLSHKPADQVSLELGFPVLSVLSLLNCPASGLVLASCFGLPTISEISISGEFAGLKQLGNLCYTESASMISIDFGQFDSSNTSDFYAVTNDLFGSIISADEMQLTLRGTGFAIDPCEIEWFNLTNLDFWQHVALSTIVKLVAMLPNLTVLSIDWLEDDMASTTDSVSVNTGAVNGHIGQLDTRIQSLFVHASSRTNSDPFMTSPVLYLAICMPVMDMLHVPDAHVDDMQSELARLAPYYIHLSNICVDCTSEPN